MRFARRFELAILALLAVAACIDLNGPDPVDITVSVANVAPPVMGNAGAPPSIRCDISLSATARSTDGKRTAAWKSAWARFAFPPDRTKFVDSLILDSAEVARAWEANTITDGRTVTSNWWFGADVPFTLELRFRYLEQGGSEARSITTPPIHCGPRPPAGAPAPTLSASPLPAGTTLEPGTLLTITYSASSNLGLWATGVVLDGGCTADTLLGERVATSVNRTVTFRIPSSCPLGQPVSLAVLAVDVALAGRVAVLADEQNVVDITPPQMTFISRTPTGDQLNDLQGAWFVGDSLRLDMTVSDNVAMRSVKWMVPAAGFRDSALVSGRFYFQRVSIAVPVSWVGAPQVLFIATDSVGLVDTVITTPSFYPSLQKPFVTRMVSGDINEVVIDTRRNAVYVMQNSGPRGVTVLSATTLATLRTIQTSGPPDVMDPTPGGDSLLVGVRNIQGFDVIDLREATPTARPVSFLDPTQVMTSLRTTANGLVFLGVSGSPGLVEYDLETGASRLRTEVAPGYYTLLLARSLDFSRLVTQGGPDLFRLYRADTDLFGPAHSASPHDMEPSMDASGTHLAVGLTLYDGDLNVTRQAQSPGTNPLTTAMSTDGQHLYHSNLAWVESLGGYMSSVMRSRFADGSLADRVAVVPHRAELIRVSADGTLMVVSESHYGTSSSRISVIDLR